MIRVVKVLDKFSLVIDHGEENGISANDKFLIYGLGEDIKDLESGESLGALEVVRGRAKVSHLQARLTTLISMTTEYHSGSKKKITREGSMYSVLGRAAVEEIEEGGTTERLPFSGAEVGDYAKPI